MIFPARRAKAAGFPIFRKETPMLIRKPDVYDAFRCIASACPDSCCQQWDVTVDEEKAAYYRGLPGELGDKLRAFLKDEEGEIYLTLDGTRCPMWQADGLCRIQAELGEGALCKTCREFPRLTHDYGSFVELGLELSCPEAARLLLESRRWQWVQEGQAETSDPDMELLLGTRERAMELTQTERPLERLLYYGISVQQVLDGDKEILEDDALPEPEGGADMEAFLKVFRGLEILTPKWKTRLENPNPRKLCREDRAMLRYLVSRYWLQAISDFDLTARVKFMVSAVLLVCLLGGEPLETAQLFSKEIENDVENVDALLDGAYALPGLTDRNLLALARRIEC